MILMNREHCGEFWTTVRLLLLVSFVLTMLVGCGSRQHTRINSELSNPEPKLVQLEETSIEAPEEIMSLPSDEHEPSSPTIQPVTSMPDRSPSESPPEPSDLGPSSDVFASSGKSSPPISVTIPQATPVPALARPSTLQGLPFTLSDIFFDYDQYTLHERDLKILETNAQVLLGRYSKKNVLIQGHCDERGTEEYNLALGIRRAQAVKDYLVDLGVPPETLQVLSYGKEKPFCTQHSWNCWKHNRRSHLVFQ